MSNDLFTQAREAMIRDQLCARGIHDPGVIEAMAATCRERFMDEADPAVVYGDHATAIDCEQTISQPYMVALMTQTLEVREDSRVLEIGTGSGYQTAILARLAGQVFTIERHAPLLAVAHERLDRLGANNVQYMHGDGAQGWPEQAPFDRILITAAAAQCPAPLLDQLAVGGVLVGPFGDCDQQTLQRIEFDGAERTVTNLMPCRFVPLVSSDE